MNHNTLVIGIAGGTGSGKTTLMKNILRRFGSAVTVLSHDNYYQCHNDMPYEARCRLNYDEPGAFDTNLMISHLKCLRRGQAVDCPVYDFAVHNRSGKTIHLIPRPVVVVEGILIFENKALRDLMDIRIFVDTDADVRLCRRIRRDVRERGRTLDSVLEQYLQTVKPMHEKYVEPSKKFADLVVPEGGKNHVALDMILGRIQNHLNLNHMEDLPMNIESLIFDIDGTLWDSRALVAEGYNIQLKKEGLDHLCTDAETLKSLFGKVMPEIGDALFASVPVPERYELLDRCMATENQYLHDNPCHIGYPGLQQTLEALSKKYRLFIVSNSQCGYPELCMNKLGISHLFAGYLCFGDTGTPKGETIRILMDRYHIQSACYVGDTQGDADAAAYANIPFIFCEYGFGHVENYWKKISKNQDLLDL